MLRVVASANLVLLEESEETFVSDIVKRTPCNENDDCSLIYCFPKQGEALWDIAKRYKVDPKSVLKSNQSVFDEDERANDCEGPILIKI